MKKLLLFVTMAASLLFTQCKKEESVSSAGKTVRMTVTAGPGSKTDITPTGAITWSDGDQLYVGDGSKYIGSLTLKSGAGSATGTFTGNVTLGEDVTGKTSFGFFYLGSAERTLTVGETSAEVDFSSQNIYAEDGKLQNASACHVGYGSATGTVVGNVVTDINVMLVSKVALAHFSFKKGDAAYTDALTLSGDNICNVMTVNFASTGFASTGTKGEISLTNTTTSEKYVMLVPTETTGSQELTFTGVNDNVEGTATLDDGIKPNQFYGKDKAIAVTLEAAAPAGRFTVDAKGTKVDFAPGNLWYGKADGETTAAFHFEADQWSSASTWDASHVSNFKWSDAANAVTDNTTYSGTLFCASNFTVDGEAGWSTLSKDEWVYLMNTRTVNGGTGEGKSYQRATVNGVYGLILYPDNYTGQTTATSYTSAEWTSMESDGVVFLPAAGYRYGTNMYDVGSYGYYWSSTLNGTSSAFRLSFDSGGVNPQGSTGRIRGYSVRLVR